MKERKGREPRTQRPSTNRWEEGQKGREEMRNKEGSCGIEKDIRQSGRRG